MFLVPETKGLSLEEMDEVFGDEGGSSAKELEHQAEIARRIGLEAYASGQPPREKAYDDLVEKV